MMLPDCIQAEKHDRLLQMFAEFSIPWVRRTFGLHFHLFIDTLNVFASTPGSELSIRFPGPDEELLFEYALLAATRVWPPTYCCSRTAAGKLAEEYLLVSLASQSWWQALSLT